MPKTRRHTQAQITNNIDFITTTYSVVGDLINRMKSGRDVTKEVHRKIYGTKPIANGFAISPIPIASSVCLSGVFYVVDKRCKIGLYCVQKANVNVVDISNGAIFDPLGPPP